MLTQFRSTRDKLLRAALTLAARDGLAAATTAAIAERAGLAEGTLYRHFVSKDDLLIEAYRALKAEILVATVDPTDAALAPADRLRRFWLGAFEAYRSDPDAFLFSQRFMESELMAREGGAASEGFMSALTEIYTAGRAASVFKDAPFDLLSSLFLAPIPPMLKREIAGRRWSEAELELAAGAVVDSWRA